MCKITAAGSKEEFIVYKKLWLDNFQEPSHFKFLPWNPVFYKHS
jgi:hypothetical protein